MRKDRASGKDKNVKCNSAANIAQAKNKVSQKKVGLSADSQLILRKGQTTSALQLCCCGLSTYFRIISVSQAAVIKHSR